MTGVAAVLAALRGVKRSINCSRAGPTPTYLIGAAKKDSSVLTYAFASGGRCS